MQSKFLVRVNISSVHVLRLIYRTSKRVWRSPVISVFCDRCRLRSYDLLADVYIVVSVLEAQTVCCFVSSFLACNKRYRLKLNTISRMVSIRVPTIFKPDLRWKNYSRLYYPKAKTRAMQYPGGRDGRPTHCHQTAGVWLEHCSSDAVSIMPLRALQRAMDELTPGNGHTTRTQREFLRVRNASIHSSSSYSTSSSLLVRARRSW